MTDQSPQRTLSVSDSTKFVSGDVLRLGRDIRVRREVIANYAITDHLPIFEDLATLAESVAYCDRLVTRHHATGWLRRLSVVLPVYHVDIFRRNAVVDALVEALNFLTGDRWSFDFVARGSAPPQAQSRFKWSQARYEHIIPFSDGLDSFSQARLSLNEHGRGLVMLVRSGLGSDRLFPNVRKLCIPRKFQGAKLRETSYRTRPIVFFTDAAIAAVATNARSIAIGENGTGSLGPACLAHPREWPFRSTHPSFVAKWQRFLNLALPEAVRFVQPQLQKTKGQVLSELQELGIASDWERTRSCSSRPVERAGFSHCGICGGCLLRAVSVHAAGINAPSLDQVFSPFSCADVGISANGAQRTMTEVERTIAVRAIALMEGVSRLAAAPRDNPAISREARLISPNHPRVAERNLKQLFGRHRSEWLGFLDALPSRSWVRDIVGRL